MKQLVNDFVSYELTQEEMLLAVTFTIAQRANLQTMLAAAAEEKVNLKVDSTNIMRFVQQEAELQGKINTLRTLLDGYETIKATMPEEEA